MGIGDLTEKEKILRSLTKEEELLLVQVCAIAGVFRKHLRRDSTTAEVYRLLIHPENPSMLRQLSYKEFERLYKPIDKKLLKAE